MLWCESSTTTTYRVSHKISATYAQLAIMCFDEFSAGLPLVLRNLSAGFCTGEVAEFPRNLRTFSTRSAHVFDERLRCNLRSVFPQRFLSKSAANSRRGRREKWRKESGGRKCVEKRVPTAQGLWHVEQFGPVLWSFCVSPRGERGTWAEGRFVDGAAHPPRSLAHARDDSSSIRRLRRRRRSCRRRLEIHCLRSE